MTRRPDVLDGRCQPPTLRRRRLTHVGLACIAWVATACGGPDVGRTTGGPLRDVTPDRRAPRHTPGPPTEEATASRPSGRPYADTPITAFAEALTDLALAAAEGRPTPRGAAPLRRTVAGPPEVRWSEHLRERPRAFTVLGIAFELELVVKRGEPAEDAEGAARYGSVRATVALSRNGLRIVELRPRVMQPSPGGGAPPAGMEGLAELARTLVGDLRRGDVTAYDLTEEDRQLLADEAVWAEAQQMRLIHARIPEIQALLEGLPDTPLAYRLDEVAILTRDDRDRLLSLSMDFDPHGESFALRVTPLVEVRRLWPREP
ncbi:MAG TPA: hypothetical protein RMH99_23595 [Sandaracinaceae bacterium LLY-WYZ-13_1]|nr:hypothetical protein [Sandaracinaceae bacterium LLY-WYZ-13_1]